jgi:hypothetical protein
LATELIKTWSSDGGDLRYCPAVPARHDYWYLIQLLALDRHVNVDHSVQSFCLTNTDIIWTDDKLSAELFPDQSLSRAQIDEVLCHPERSKQLITDHGLDPARYHLRLPRWDEFIRLAVPLGWADNHVVPVDGYRLTATGEKRALLAGSPHLGGANYIDAWWQDAPRLDQKIHLVMAPI